MDSNTSSVSLYECTFSIRSQFDNHQVCFVPRKLLNDMIYESLEKYDKEIAKCTDYYAKQCALMEVARGQIASANFIAATSRALILDAQYNINKCQVSPMLFRQ